MEPQTARPRVGILVQWTKQHSRHECRSRARKPSRICRHIWRTWCDSAQWPTDKGKAISCGSTGMGIQTIRSRTCHTLCLDPLALHAPFLEPSGSERTGRGPRIGIWDIELKKILQSGDAKASFIFPSVGHFAVHRSGILRNSKERKPEWGAWYVQEGVAPDPNDDGHIDRQIWWWSPSPTPLPRKTTETSLATVAVLDEGNHDMLNWKTYFKRNPKLKEPIDSGMPFGPGSASVPPPPQPLTQQEMRDMFDVEKMVMPADAEHGTRKERANRNQRMLAKFRFFTQSWSEAMWLL